MHRCNAVYTRRTVTAPADEQGVPPLVGAETDGGPPASPYETHPPASSRRVVTDPATLTLGPSAVRGQDGCAR